MKQMVCLVVSVVASWLAASTLIQAKPGDVDTTFGHAGWSTTGFSSGNESAYGLALQPDGKQVVVGESGPRLALEGFHFTVVRCLADGSLDLAFGNGGRIVMTLGTSSRARAVRLQTDGKLVVAGEALFGNNWAFVLARYHADGTLDTSFGTQGVATLNSGTTCRLESLRLLNDGKLLIAGQVGALEGHLKLARYLPNGTLDTSFDGDGVVDYTETSPLAVGEMITQGDGKILVTGRLNSRMTVWRFLESGALDLSFNGSGRAVSTLNNSFGEAINFQPGGVTLFDPPTQIVVTGGASINGQVVLTLSRLNLEGTWDTTFGVSGHVVTPLESYAMGRAVLAVATLRGATHLVVAADIRRTFDSKYGIALLKYRLDGTLDSSFGNNGIGITMAGIGGSSVQAMVLASGRLTLAGTASNGSRSGDFMLLRHLLTTGEADQDFGQRGKVLLDFPQEGGYASDLAALPDGRLLVTGGTRQARTFSAAYVAGLTNDGAPDPAFGAFGRTSSPAGYQTPNGAVALAVRPDERFYAVGTYDSNSPGSRTGFLTQRFLPDGRPDMEFNGSGSVVIDVSELDDLVSDVAITPEGGAIVAGLQVNSAQGSTLLALLRLQPDGFLDTNFENQGKVLNAIQGLYHGLPRVLVQPDGKILVSATCNTADRPIFGLMRFLANGRVDVTFAAFGRVSTALGDKAYVEDLALLPDGKILVAGRVHHLASVQSDLAVVRYLADGRLDTTFGDQGIVLRPLGLAEHAPVRIVLQSDGKILCATTRLSGGNTRVVVTRLLAGGAPDATFGNGGLFTPLFGAETEQQVEALTVDADGRIVLAGQTGPSAFVARLQNERWEILSISRLNNGSVRLEGSGIPLGTTILHSSTTLLPGSFSPLDTVQADGNGRWLFDDANASTLPQRFYRLQAL